MALVTHMLIKFLNHQDIMFRPILFGTSPAPLPFLSDKGKTLRKVEINETLALIQLQLLLNTGQTQA